MILPRARAWLARRICPPCIDAPQPAGRPLAEFFSSGALYEFNRHTCWPLGIHIAFHFNEFYDDGSPGPANLIYGWECVPKEVADQFVPDPADASIRIEAFRELARQVRSGASPSTDRPDV